MPSDVSLTTAILIILVCAITTFSLRAFPFVVFGSGKKIPNNVLYLGRVLPSCITAILIIYCIKDSSFKHPNSLFASLISIALVAIIHAWRKNTILSVVLGTACYMILIRTIFPI